jgi:hypothetical protein
MAAPLPFPYRLDNATMIHSRSMRPAMSACAGLPEYRLLTTFELSGTTIETSSIDSSEDSDGWTGVDFSGLRNLEGLRRFIGVYNNPLNCPDFDGENYDPSRECFYIGDKEVSLAEATPIGPSVHAPLQRTLPLRPSQEQPTMSAPMGTH